MAMGIVIYEDGYGDLSHVGVNANNRSDAEDEVRSEYGNVAEIIDIYKSN